MSLLCSRLRLSRLLFVTSPCFLLKVSIGSLSVFTSLLYSGLRLSLLPFCYDSVIFSRFPLFHYLFVTSVLCSRLRQFLLLFTSICFLLVVSIVPLLCLLRQSTISSRF